MAGEVSLEAAAGFAGAFAFCGPAGDVGAGWFMASGSGEDHGVEGAVEGAVATTVCFQKLPPVTVSRPRATGPGPARRLTGLLAIRPG